jgi:hypothetical protein
VLDKLFLEPPSERVPVKFQKYPELCAAYEELFKDGGIGKISALIGQTLAAAVERELRDTARSKMQAICRELRTGVEAHERLRGGGDLLPDINACMKIVGELLSKLGRKTDFFDDSAHKMRDELVRQFEMLFPQNARNDERKPAELAAAFPTHADNLEAKLHGLMQAQVIPGRYRAIAAEFQGLPDVPVSNQPSVAAAWAQLSDQDAAQAGRDWGGAMYPTFLSRELFADLEDGKADGKTDGKAKVFSPLNGATYRGMMHEKVKVVTHQSAHVLRGQLRRRLEEIEKELARLVQMGTSLKAGRGKQVDYEAIYKELRTVCP